MAMLYAALVSSAPKKLYRLKLEFSANIFWLGKELKR